MGPGPPLEARWELRPAGALGRRRVGAQGPAPRAREGAALAARERPDERGYHRVDSIMVATSLKDEIVIKESDKLSVSCIPQVDFPEE